MRLDILTPRGQQTREDEAAAVRIFNRHYPDTAYIETDKEKPAVIDAVLVRGSELVGAVEIKCRQRLSLATFRGEYGSEWLVTFDKVIGAKQAAEAMWTPLWGFLYLVQEQALLFRRLWTPEKGWSVGFRVEKTETQATVNGGRAIRDNAYIDMTNATELR